MNKKNQFFLISGIIIALSLATIMTFLSVPETLSLSETEREKNMFNILTEAKKSLDSAYLDNNEYISAFTIKNPNNQELSYTIIRKTINSSQNPVNTRLYDSNKKEIRHKSILLGTNTLLISFEEKLESDSEKYTLTYSNTTRNKKLENTETIIREESDNIYYKSNNYGIRINKNTGIIQELYIEGHTKNFVQNINSRIKNSTDDYSQTSSDTEVIKYADDVLTVRITGDYNNHAGYEQYWYFLPQKIYVDYKIILSQAYDYTPYFVFRTTNLPNLAYENTVETNLNQASETVFNTNKWYSVFNTTEGIGISYYNNYVSTKQTTPGIDTRIYYDSNITSSGNYSIFFEITPHNYDYTRIREASRINNYNKEAGTTMLKETKYQESMKSLKNQLVEYNYLISSTYENKKFIEKITAQTNWLNPEYDYRKIITYYSGKNSIPFACSIRLPSDADFDSIKDLSTKNYNNDSILGELIFYNQEPTIFKTLNTDAQDYSITINYNPQTINDDLRIIVNNPENQKITDQTISGNNGVWNNQEIIINNNMSGVHTINMSGQNVYYKISTQNPLINVKTPFLLNNTKETMIYYEKNTPYNITIESSPSTRVILKNGFSTIMNSTTPITQGITPTIENSPYYLTTQNGEINITTQPVMSMGFEKNYFDEENLWVEVMGREKIYFNKTNDNSFIPERTNSFNYSVTQKKLNNTNYEWDFDNNILSYKDSNNWFHTGNFFTCSLDNTTNCITTTNNYDYEGIIEDRSSRKITYYTSQLNNNLIVENYKNKDFVKLIITPPDNNFLFAPLMNTCGTIDDYYKTTNNEEETITGLTNLTYEEVLNHEWSYAGKRSDNDYLIIFYKNNDLLPTNPAIRISQDALYFAFKNKTINLYLLMTNQGWSYADYLIKELESARECRNNITINHANIIGNNIQLIQDFT